MTGELIGQPVPAQPTICPREVEPSLLIAWAEVRETFEYLATARAVIEFAVQNAGQMHDVDIGGLQREQSPAAVECVGGLAFATQGRELRHAR
jgi:hypothetical protein